VHSENSEVAPAGSVAVAVRCSPDGRLRVALPEASVTGRRRLSKVAPSPKPESSHTLLLKTSIVYFVFGAPCSVTFVAVITDPDVHFKLVFADRKLGAAAALVDPDLVEAAPSHVIAATGADALAHAVESYVNRGSDPLLAALTIAAIRIIGGNLRAAVETREPAALEQLMLASTMAGIAFNMNANAIVHAASTPVTARHGVPHGVANGIFMPPGLAFLAPACARELREVAEALGEAVSGLSDEEAAERAVEHIRTLLKSIGIPATLREWGIDAARFDIPQLVEDAMKSRNIATNPRPVTPADLEELYRAVLG